MDDREEIIKRMEKKTNWLRFRICDALDCGDPNTARLYTELDDVMVEAIRKLKEDGETIDVLKRRSVWGR